MNLNGYLTTFTMEVFGLYFVLAIFGTKQVGVSTSSCHMGNGRLYETLK